jgi:hypothetical protein
MIDTREIAILKTFKYFPLSSRIDEYKNLIPGKYVRYKLSYQDYDNPTDEVEFLVNGRLGENTLDTWENETWNVRLGVSVLDNYFDVSGLSTTSIKYLDDCVIYTKDALYIKKEHLKDFDSNEKIIQYFATIENKWLIEQQRLQTEICHIDRHLYYSVKDYLWVAFVAFCTSIAAMFFDIKLLLIFPIVLGLLFMYWTFGKLKRRHFIKRYKAEHPKDKLANYICLDAFKYENFILHNA